MDGVTFTEQQAIDWLMKTAKTLGQGFHCDDYEEWEDIIKASYPDIDPEISEEFCEKMAECYEVLGVDGPNNVYVVAMRGWDQVN